jgi:hypothetical protein
MSPLSDVLSRLRSRMRPALQAALLCTGMALGQAQASALFVDGSSFTVQGNNTPGNFSESVTLTPGVTALNGGALMLTLSVVPDGTNEWLVFRYHTPNGTPLANPTLGWSIGHVGLQAAVAVNFNAAYLAFTDDGSALTPTSNIFGGYSIVADPVPGGSGFGFGASGFSGLFAAGPLPNLGAFISPYSFLNATGIDSSQVDGFVQAFRFAPQVPVTPVPEPAGYALVLLTLVLLAQRQRSLRGGIRRG